MARRLAILGRIQGLSLAMLLSWSCFGCGVLTGNPNVEKYSAKMNQDRIKRKLPIVPGNWTVYSALRTQIDWVNPPFQDPVTYPGTSGKAMHATKQILLDADGNPDQETDTYYSGKKNHGVDPDSGFLGESISITYNYQSEKNDFVKPLWQCDVSCGPEEGEHTIDEAEAILKRWGIQRLNYQVVPPKN